MKLILSILPSTLAKPSEKSPFVDETEQKGRYDGGRSWISRANLDSKHWYFRQCPKVQVEFANYRAAANPLEIVFRI